MEGLFKGWPPCDRCGKPVNRRSGVLSIEPPEPSETRSGPVELRDLARQELCREWLWSHGRCRPRRNLYWIEAEQFDTLDKVLDWTLHLAEKNWYQATNWQGTVRRFYNVPGI